MWVHVLDIPKWTPKMDPDAYETYCFLDILLIPASRQVFHFSFSTSHVWDLHSQVSHFSLGSKSHVGCAFASIPFLISVRVTCVVYGSILCTSYHTFSAYPDSIYLFVHFPSSVFTRSGKASSILFFPGSNQSRTIYHMPRSRVLI